MKSTFTRSSFVVFGFKRARSALKLDVRRQVEGEFAEQWKACGFVRRWFLRRKINAEIVRRLAERAPPDALY